MDALCCLISLDSLSVLCDDVSSGGTTSRDLGVRGVPGGVARDTVDNGIVLAIIVSIEPSQPGPP